MSNREEEGIRIVPLFVGLTRPTTLFGLPLNAFVLNMMVIIIGYLTTKNFIVLAGGIPTHFILMSLTQKDIHFFDNFRLFGMTKGRCRNKSKWRGSASFSPIEIDSKKVSDTFYEEH